MWSTYHQTKPWWHLSYWQSNNNWFIVFSFVIRKAYYSMLQNSVTDVLRKPNMQVLTNFKPVLTCFRFCLNMETRINKTGKQAQINTQTNSLFTRFHESILQILVSTIFSAPALVKFRHFIPTARFCSM
jgi:hypothetical protein